MWVTFSHTCISSIYLREKGVEIYVAYMLGLSFNISCLITYGPLILFSFLFNLKSQPDKFCISYITVLNGFCVDEWICQLLPCL